jgi:hypothetical protein
MDETYDGPFYQGFVFVLVSAAGKANHILTISLQIDGFGPNAGILGTWRSQDNPSSLKPVEGWISQGGGGIECQWSTPNGTNVLTGTLTYNPGRFTRLTGLAWPSAFLDGDVTAYDAQGNPTGGGPGHVSGTGMRQMVAV